MSSDIDICLIHGSLCHRRRDSHGLSKGWYCPDCELDRRRKPRADRVCPVNRDHGQMTHLMSGGRPNGWRCYPCYNARMRDKRRHGASARRSRLLFRTKRPS